MPQRPPNGFPDYRIDGLVWEWRGVSEANSRSVTGIAECTHRNAGGTSASKATGHPENWKKTRHLRGKQSKVN
ncbi:NmrA family protein [Anopheles sinensis]|uniref:NmrA family protein n=1 Tax=Anopheles sinensis TaxID=74873 RepID=A0A084WBR3_ANOSI|nr:NmrA family protein [Anopheles sinensis]